MPTKIVQTFTTNTLNQVVRAGDQELVTIQSGQMGKMAAAQVEAQRTEVIKSRVQTLLDNSGNMKGAQNGTSNSPKSGTASSTGVEGY